jgi:hypothetical protein
VGAGHPPAVVDSLVLAHARSVVGDQHATEQRDQRPALGFRENLKVLRLGALGDGQEPPLQRPPGWCEGDALTAAVIGVPDTLDKPVLLDVIEIADQVASVETEAIGKLVLRERSEIGESRKHAEMRQSKIVFREGL